MTPDALANRTVARARDTGASNEAIIRAALMGMPLREQTALLTRLRDETWRSEREVIANAPVGSRIDR